MNQFPVLTLKAGSDVHLRNRHHAIFQTAVQTFPAVEDGSIVEVRDSRGDFLCYATLNRQAYICGRAIAFEKGDPLIALRKLIEHAVALRKTLFATEDTTAYRLVNAEGDGLPGLIVDRYNDILVIQLTTLGFDHLRTWLADTLMELLKPKGIFEKSTGPARKKEGMEEEEGWVRGKGEGTVEVKERGIKYLITLEGSQKTGLFLDQREMRSLVRNFAKDRTVLDCCSYVGGFSVNALAGGALHADAVDYDAAALARATEHVQLNGFGADRFSSSAEDVFNFLRRRPLPHPYDFIILDPPAFAKRSSDLDPAKKAYTDLNRLAFQILPPGGLLLTCSCSYQINAEIFQTIVFHAARQAKRSVQIIQRHRQALDHPVNLFHPEGDYLKSLLLWVK
ncbi:MAG: class I SAM-dependent rRNA methyltransferase [Candidatus Peribacteraceae bacterium]|nr:class I SAM-dependent rRNA methyltransferase [Candidatus Peribacteraceae bacterium]MDD5074459.1 class I SAM-dependent rRNA methyltransferase [Candidatus Peribacteraceae bacterium]